jgi:hypothetical protein
MGPFSTDTELLLRTEETQMKYLTEWNDSIWLSCQPEISSCTVRAQSCSYYNRTCWFRVFCMRAAAFTILPRSSSLVCDFYWRTSSFIYPLKKNPERNEIWWTRRPPAILWYPQQRSQGDVTCRFVATYFIWRRKELLPKEMMPRFVEKWGRTVNGPQD